MESKLIGRKIAILAVDGVEQIELVHPRLALHNAGAEIVLVSIDEGEIRAWNGTDWGEILPVDQRAIDSLADEFDALFLPGGVMNADTLRMNRSVISFVKGFFNQGKPVAAICHAPWLLIEAGVVAGKTITAYPSLKTDLINAGAHWVDQEVAVDTGLVTSRSPRDIEAFISKMLEEFGKGIRD